jgi:hypothetical protein
LLNPWVPTRYCRKPEELPRFEVFPDYTTQLSLGLSPLTSLVPLLKTGDLLPSPWAPTRFLQKIHENFRIEVSPAYEAMQKGKGAPVDSGNWVEDSFEEECGGCSRIRLQLGAIGANRAFELETLSQHRHMIEKLQDESYAQ